ncbi:MAG: hypothetical protein U0V87_10010 [Acidobacteriota bacterium]
MTMRTRTLVGFTGVLVAFAIAWPLAAAPQAPAAKPPQPNAADQEPDYPHGNLEADCYICHSEQGWRPARISKDFNHKEMSKGFALSGAHATAQCTGCHKTLDFAQNRGSNCFNCHQDVHRSELGNDCARCHTTVTFVDRSQQINMHRTSRFPLSGAHSTLDCASCHVSSAQGKRVFVGTPTDCYSCHRAQYESTRDPNHKTAGFPTDCAQCHSTRAWDQAIFDHNKTNFPLTGAHRAQACPACHPGGKFQGTSTDCYSCHKTNYDSTSNPNHRAAGFPTDCKACHTTTNWNSNFDHSTTDFPLTGAHRNQPCPACHADGVYNGKSTACYSCHKPQYDSTTNPNHRAAGFSTDCSQCHTTTSWDGANFDHAGTDFPLTGAHRNQPCDACHADGVYNGKSTDCYSCHRANYDSTTNPNHRAAGFPTDCKQCHTTTNWDSNFDHNTTDFPLTGAHRNQPCPACHADGVYNGKSTACYSCHKPQYDSTTNPNHRAAGFSTDCSQCHTTTSWDGASFDHNGTDFPLTGAHRNQPCDACHADGVYNGKSTDCYSCHRSNYDSTTNPNHRAAGFPTDCKQCHTTTNWDSNFDHNTTDFPLTGAHKNLPCNACHADGVYNGKPTACYSCHKSDYDNTTDPNHRAAGFPTDCTACHTTTTWAGARFEHDADYFPIYSGAHRGKWNNCSDCHTNSNNYAEFSCLGCHPHSNKSKTDGDHRGISGYSYDSRACYRCHPRGRAD